MSEIRAGEVAAPGSYHPSDEVKFPRFLLHPARDLATLSGRRALSRLR